jgi:tRNA-2-methylthio-N6-dimethylallyladenosine synthase
MSRSFYLRVFGCQMNQHDAEKIGNLLYHADYLATDTIGAADLILIHTCSVREKAESKLYSELGAIRRLKRERPELIVGVGGCVAQQEGRALLSRFDHLDFVFGSQNLRHLPAMIEQAQQRRRSLRIDFEADRELRFDLPERHPDYPARTPGRAFVTVMEGCDLFCAFCVVPTTRGREVSRPSLAILEEVRERAAHGVVEVTLLGQTVNAYGRPRPGMAHGEMPFAELIASIAAIPGIRRVRFTSPHPIFMTPELIRAYGRVEELCPHLHLPVQSGADATLSAMNRRYTRGEYLETVAALRRARPGLAISTDLIVGFPGESDRDFEDTLDLVREVDFIDSFSFVYSSRPGTRATRNADGAVEPEIARERLARLQAQQDQQTLSHHQRRVGRRVEVLVEGPSKRGGRQQQGRCPEHRVVNFTAAAPVPTGSFVMVEISEAQPHSMLGARVDSREPIPEPAAPGPLELPLV